MLAFLRRLFSRDASGSMTLPSLPIAAEDLVWAMGSYCALNRKPFDPALLIKQFPPLYSTDSLIYAARALGFRIQGKRMTSQALAGLPLPCLVLLQEKSAASANGEEGAQDTRQVISGEANSNIAADRIRPALLIQAGEEGFALFKAGTNTRVILSQAEFDACYQGIVYQLALTSKPVSDPDHAGSQGNAFGFGWFIPELLKHKKVWRDVLIASLVIQLLALGTPLFTQVIIDKVVVHRTESTLFVIAFGLIVFMVFSSVMTWVRQYLVLHTGNRVDAVLGAAVFEHLFKLPPRYFEHRPTGVIAARLRGVENIREFVASAAVTLILDFPFLLIFAGIMFYYNVGLTLLALSLIGIIIVMSLIVAPIFREKLNEQFLLGARNQAFTTEYVSGLETVKSLQMEPQLNARYSDYLADYLHSGFIVRQLANSYNVLANLIEQLMSTLILIIGAYTVMHSTDFTIGMLVAFQMFASRLSQPMLRMVGLWQQFQQASMSVVRLGDIMNAPAEPYSIVPNRTREGQGKIEIQNLSFRYNDNLPFLYEGFEMAVNPGSVVAIMGPSGSGKSTLAKLLQGFYLPASGTIKIDGTDVHHLSANQLRSYFGVVPQEIMLFSGTLYDNLLMANPHATFEQVVQACKMAEIHDVIEGLPQGYQTEIGERGVGLSGGQKQRLAIARALLKQPKVLIFDEATSSLDMATAEHFAETINQMKSKVTMIFITHAMPKNLLVDEMVRIGGETKASTAPVTELTASSLSDQRASLRSVASDKLTTIATEK